MGPCMVGRKAEKSFEISNTSDKQIIFSVIGEGEINAF
jgi:hypothetical protein